MPAELQKQGKQAKKGKTLEEVEEEEGGTIKESRVPMAKTLRSQQRKGKSKGALPLPSHQRHRLR